MDTRISTIEQNMQTMEMNIQKRFDSSMDKLFSRLQESQSVKTTHEPPGGAIAGGGKMTSCHGSAVGWRLSRDINGRSGRQEPNRQEEYVGDRCEGKEKDCFRIMTQNINGIGQEAGNIKEKSVKAFIQDFDIDIMALQQLNVCWNKVGNQNKIWDRFRGWQENCNLSVSYNTEDANRKAFQPGGGQR